MKTLFALALILLFAVVSNGQSVVWTSDLVDVLYAGYNNTLPLKFVDVEAKDVKLSVTDGALTQNDKERFVWTSSRGGHTETLTATYDGKTIGTFTMKFVRFPDPVVTTMTTNSAIKNFKGLKCIMPGVRLNIPTSIQSYEIHILNNGDLTVLKNRGGALTAQNKKQMRYINANAQVTAKRIIGRCPGDKAGRRLNDVQLQ